MSWFCRHSMMPLPDGCAECGVDAPQQAPAKPAAPPAKPKPLAKPKPAVGAKPAVAGKPAVAASKPAAARPPPPKAARPPPPKAAGRPPPPKAAGRPPPPAGAPQPSSRPSSQADSDVASESEAYHTAEESDEGATTQAGDNNADEAEPDKAEAEGDNAHEEEESKEEEEAAAAVDNEAAASAAAAKPPRPRPASVKRPPGPTAAPTRPKPPSRQGSVQSTGGDKPPKPAPPRGGSVKRPPAPAGGRPATSVKSKPAAPEPPALPPRPTKGHPLYPLMFTGPRGEVLYTWAAEHEGEVSVEEGDIVKLRKWVNPEWIEVEVEGKIGSMPVAFLDITEELAVEGPQAIALYAFEGANELELSFEADDIIALLGFVDSEWFYGELCGAKGYFPSNFVEVITDLPPGTEPTPFSEEYLKLVEEMEKAQGGEIPEEDGHEGTGHEEGRQEEDHGEEGHVEEHDNEQQAAEVKADEEPEPAPAAEPKEEEPAQEEKPTAKAAPRPRKRHHFKSVEGGDSGSSETDASAAAPPKAAPRQAAAKPAASGGGSSAGPPMARATKAYKAKDIIELSFRAGDEIELIETFGDDWLKGRIGNESGIFPVECVQVVRPLPESTGNDAPLRSFASNSVNTITGSDDSGGTSSGAAGGSGSGAAEAGTGLARALYDYPAEHEGDLPFDPDDEIVLLEKIDDSWFRGSCKGKTGMFPKDFVEIITPIPDKPKPAPKKVAVPPRPTGLAKAVHEYPEPGTDRHPDDLHIVPGDEITLLEKIGDDWFRGEVRGEKGMFPAAFVEVVRGV